MSPFSVSSLMTEMNTAAMWHHYCIKDMNVLRWISWDSKKLHQAGSRGTVLRRLLQVSIATRYYQPSFAAELQAESLIYLSIYLSVFTVLRSGLWLRMRDGTSGLHYWSLSRSFSFSIPSWWDWRKQVANRVALSRVFDWQMNVWIFFFNQNLVCIHFRARWFSCGL